MQLVATISSHTSRVAAAVPLEGVVGSADELRRAPLVRRIFLCGRVKLIPAAGNYDLILRVAEGDV
ncbi:hypothetical protein, partial [Rhodovulum sp. PH10]|uniref:hypothetical protein n=1 Tax=Rhodovulum sp. PH10 TaxID=1187851 RepID=UPI001ED972F5